MLSFFRRRFLLAAFVALTCCPLEWNAMSPLIALAQAPSGVKPLAPEPSNTTAASSQHVAQAASVPEVVAPASGVEAISAMAMVASIEATTVAAIERAERSVVAISRVRRGQTPAVRADQLAGPDQLAGLGQFPFSDSPESADYVPSEFASGVIISDDGMIVTCAHALDDPRNYDYYVWLDKRVYSGAVVGKSATVMASDPYTDLGVLKIDVTGLTPITFGDASLLRKGSFVISLGNPYATARDGQASASWGIVSNLRRTPPPRQSTENSLLAKESQDQFGTLIQTDARLNFGTSGGALINLRGEMVGLTSSLAALGGFEQSAGYAIAVDSMFSRVVDALRQGQQPEFGFLGIQPEELRPAERLAGLSGARVSLVIPGLPGDQAGLRNDDCIIGINSQVIRDRSGLFRELSQLPAGAEVELAIQRPRRGDAGFTQLHLKATLSKKFISTSRPAYAIHSAKPWRGMLVEYTTAIPGELMRGDILTHRRAGAQLAVLSVDPDSPAWRAGLRAGHSVLSINGRRVATPDDFYTQANLLQETVQLQVYRGSERLEAVGVPAS